MRLGQFMTKLRTKTTVVCVALAAALFFTAVVAWAFFISVEVVGKVALGQNPKLVLTGLVPAQATTVKLKREDGQSFTFSLGSVRTDEIREVMLDGRLGHHHYQGAVTAQVDAEQVSTALDFETVVAAPIELTVDRKKLDLAARTLVFSANVALAHAQLVVVDVYDNRFFDQQFDVSDVAARKPITLRWKGGHADDVMRLELRGEDANGFFKSIALTPWSVSIPHEEVLFATNSADIAAQEESKLQASLEAITATLERFAQIKGVQLFIAGHSDTVGKPAHNAHLSRLRAQAIGNWFVAHDVPTSVYFEGFGESSPKVKTGDEVAEPQNRRVDYILAVDLPTLHSQAHGWKRLK